MKISRDEMVAMIFLLLFAGYETTTHLISGAVYELVKTPALRDWLKADWKRADLAVEEFLRFISPVNFSKPRFVRKDTELCGVRRIGERPFRIRSGRPARRKRNNSSCQHGP